MLDTVHRVETPEGVDLDLRTAGPIPRMLAWLVDFALRVVVAIGLSIPAAVLGDFGMGLTLIIFFVLEWFYPVVFEVLRDGSTPGKRMLKLRVVHADGTPVGWSSSMLRNLLRTADFLPLFYGIGFLCCLSSGRFRRLGDLAAGTLVVYRDVEKKRAVERKVRAIPPAATLTLDEQRAVIGYARRLPRLSRGRAQELAQIAAPVVVPDVDYRARENPIEALTSVGAWLRGKRYEGGEP